MLGIPTRTDAMMASTAYADVVHTKDLSDRIESACRLPTLVLPVNHVVEAYRDTDNMSLYGRDFHHQLGKSVPRSVIRLLKPDYVLSHYFDWVHTLRTLLEEIEREVNKTVTSYVFSQRFHEPIGLSSLVTWRKIELDEEGKELLHMGQSGCDEGVYYSYNPFELANEILDEFGLELTRVSSGDTKYRKICRIMQVVESFSRNPNCDLVARGLRDHGLADRMSSVSVPSDDPYHALLEEHATISARSDVYLSFDEKQFVHQRLSGEDPPRDIDYWYAQEILNPSVSFSGLVERLRLRDGLLDLLKKNRAVTFNGKTYRASIVDIGDKAVVGLESSGIVSVDIANAFCLRLKSSDGEVVMPNLWLMQEKHCVDAYRAGEAWTVEAILDGYEDVCFSHGNATKKKALERMRQGLIRNSDS